MSRATHLLLIAAIVTFGTAALTQPPLQAESPQEERDKPAPEKEAWQKVDNMNSAALEEFLKKYPGGESAADAKLQLGLHKKIQDIRKGRIKPHWVVSFEELGERWKYWQEANPRIDALGVYRNESTAGIFRSLGSGSIRTDYSGMPMMPTGDSSILGIKTFGLPYRYIGDLVFQTENDGIMYFGVIHGKGLVHLYGKGSVTTPDGNIQLMNAQ